MLASRIPVPDEIPEIARPLYLIGAGDVRAMFGGVSDMTLWRWLNDQELNFPKPIYIGKRRYWRASDLTSWLQARADA